MTDTDLGHRIQVIPPSLPTHDGAEIKLFLLGGINVVAAKRSDGIRFVDVSQHDFTIQPMVWTRLRLLVVHSSGTAQQVSFRGVDPQLPEACEVRPMAFDGTLLSSLPGDPSQDPFYHTSGAGRIDFAVRCMADFYLTVFGADVVISVTHTSTVGGSRELTAWQPVRPAYLRDLMDEEVPEENQHTVWASMSALTWDGVAYKWPASPSATCSPNRNPYRCGQVYEMTISHSDAHPIHLHVFPMQIIGECEGYLTGEWYDTITSDSFCIVRFNAYHIGGAVVIHCHYLMHEDMGAMSYLQLCDGPDLGPLVDPPLEQTSCHL